MQRIRIHRLRVRREHPWHEVLPLDPRDPDVVRAKALARARRSRRQKNTQAVTFPPARRDGGLTGPRGSPGERPAGSNQSRPCPPS